MILNKSPAERIRSIFHNQMNDSVFIVSVKEKPDASKMKCRSVPLKDIQNAFEADKFEQPLGIKLFTNFTLKWPDFIEFDELNGKIVTRHAENNEFRVWNLINYQLLYLLTHDFLAEFKICNGIMLLLFNPVQNSIPMTILDVQTGQPLMNIAYQGPLSEIEFVEQFNEQILIKQKGKSLKIHNILSNQSKHIDNFESPDAFIFVYEKECFISLQGGKVQMWNTDGQLISNFGKQVLYSQTKRQDSNQDRNYVISLSSSRKFLFTLIKENQLDVSERISVMNQFQNLDKPISQAQEQEDQIFSFPLVNQVQAPVQASPISQHQIQNLNNNNIFSQHLQQNNQNRVLTPVQANIRPNFQHQRPSNQIILNVIDIQKGSIIASINPFSETQSKEILSSKKNTKQQADKTLSENFTLKKLEKIMNQISYVHYDEARHEIITGHENGSIVIWQ